jgi:hypothetical protein
VRVQTFFALITILFGSSTFALERKDLTFRVFQFPANQIPRIDGQTNDWALVPDSYAVGMDQLMDTEQGHGLKHDPGVA